MDVEKLAEPVQLPQKTHASRELVIRKKEAKVEVMKTSSIKPAVEDNYQEKVSVY